MGRLLVVIGLMVLSAATGCAPSASPSGTLDPAREAVCRVVPIARQLRLDIDAAVTAARRGDEAAMTKAAADARARGAEIASSLRDQQPAAEVDQVVADLVSIGLFGDQAGFVFEGVGVPDAESLASLTSGLPAVDGVLARLEADLAGAGLALCWDR